MDWEWQAFALGVATFVVCSSFFSRNESGSLRRDLRRLEHKLDLLLRASGIEPPAIPPTGEDKIEAIKQYRREHPEVGLSEAKAIIDERYRSEAHGSRTWPPPPSERVLSVYNSGQKIQAIKAYREENPGVNLKDAKEVIDGL